MEGRVNMNLMVAAELNLEQLARTPHLGDGIGVGMDETGKFLVQLCWITEEDSERRDHIVFEQNGERVSIRGENLVYMAKCGDFAIVSNGFTGGIAHGYKEGENFEGWVKKCAHKPNELGCGRRIAACSWWKSTGEPVFQMGVLQKASLGDGFGASLCDWDLRGRVLGWRGLGYYTAISEDPLPFTLKLDVLPLRGDARQIADMLFWRMLNQRTRAAVAVKFTPWHGDSEIAIVH